MFDEYILKNRMWLDSFCYAVLNAVELISICSTIVFVLHSNTSNSCKPYYAMHSSLISFVSLSPPKSNTPHIIQVLQLSLVFQLTLTLLTHTLLCAAEMGGKASRMHDPYPSLSTKISSFFACSATSVLNRIIKIETVTDIRESIIQELVFSTLRLRVHLHIAARNARMRLLIHHSQLSRLHRQCHEQRIVQRITSSAQYSVSFRTSTKTFFSLYSIGSV